jgi:hypothetical protein
MGERAAIAITNEENAVTVKSNSEGAQILYLQYALRPKTDQVPN